MTISLHRIGRSTKRFQEIVGTLGKYRIAEWISEDSPGFLKDLFQDQEGETLVGITPEERTRLALTELGTTFIKLGQMLSTRPDVVGPALAAELSGLQDDVPADPPEAVREMIVTELGSSPDEIFGRFQPEALASASIGQVHAAARRDGREVIVKVQHPGIEQTIREDLDVLEILADLAEKHVSALRPYQPVALAAEFRRGLLRELDFRREARNLAEFRRNFEGSASVEFPEPFADLSTQRVLTMQRLRGLPISEPERLAKEGLDTEAVTRRGANLFMEMIFRHGFYHGDPHPGNFLVLPDGTIGLLDCGSAARLDDAMREDLEDVLLAAVDGDADLFTESVLRIGLPPGTLDRTALRADLADLLADLAGQSLEGFDMSGVLLDFMRIVRSYRIPLRPGVARLIKTLVQLEGTSRLLSRDFSLAEIAEPYYEKAIGRRLSPDRMGRRMKRAYREWNRLLGILPGDLTDILSRIRKGSFDVHLQHRRLDSVVNRLAYGILTGALVLAAAQLLVGEVPPAVAGLSLPGVGAATLALWLGYRLLRAAGRFGGLGRREED